MISGRHPGWHFGGLLAVLIVGGGLLAFLMRERPEPLEVADPAQLTTNSSSNASSVAAEYVVIGGVRRRRSDIEQQRQGDRSSSQDPKTFDGDALRGYGNTPPVAADANPQVAAAVEAARTNTNPERLSPVVQPATFDVKAFEADPQAYVDGVEPGRVFQPAQPGEEVREIRRRSPRYVPVLQGDPVMLAVEAIPGAPVTFTSFDLGQFSNELTSITVRANDQGVAQAEFVAPPGTIADVNILAASPQTSGQVKFVVNVSLPNE